MTGHSEGRYDSGRDTPRQTAWMQVAIKKGRAAGGRSSGQGEEAGWAGRTLPAV